MPARILIVDDETVAAESTRDILEQLGYAAAGFVNSAEAALAAIERERPDLVLMDINLHQSQEDIGAAETIRTRHALPIVCLMAHMDEAILAHIKTAHPFGYVIRPFAAHNLRIAIEAALHNHALEERLRRSELALAERTETYRALLTATLDGVVETDEHDRIIDANMAFCRMLGYTRMELTTLRLPDIEAVETPAMVAQHSRQLRREGSGRFETRHRAKDGRLIDVEVSVTYIPSRRRIVAFCHDITKRKHAEEALRREQALFNDLIHTIPDNLYFKDRKSRFVRINDAMARSFGMRNAGEAAGKTDFDVFSEEHARQAFEDEQRIMSTGQPLIGLVEKETWPDGHVSWASTTKVPLRDAHGEITGLVGISRDITASKQDAERIREQAALLDNANDAIYVRTLDRTITYWNRGAEQLYGWPAAEAVGRKETDLFLPAEAGLADAEAVLLDQNSWTGEMQHATRNGGNVTVFCRWSLVRDDDGKPQRVFAIHTDITEKKRLEAVIRREASKPPFQGQ